MASEAGSASSPRRLETDSQLSDDWRRLGRAATAVAVVTAPGAFTWFHKHNGWGLGWSLLATILDIGAFRRVIDVIPRPVSRCPSLSPTDDARLRPEDAVHLLRSWFWRWILRWVFRV